MSAISIPCLVPRTNKAGVTSWYWQPSATLARAKWPPVPLGKDRAKAMQRAEEINAQVARWKAGGSPPSTIAPRTPTGTVAALVARYRRERLFDAARNGRQPLSPKTREGYETSLKRIEAWAGKHPVEYVTPARIEVLRDVNLAEDQLGHSATYALLKTLRQLMAFAEQVEVIPKNSNPATSFGLSAPRARHQVWEAADEKAFIASAYAMGLPGMALAVELAIYTAQREADLLAMNEHELGTVEIFDEATRKAFADANGNVTAWTITQGKSSRRKNPTVLEIPLEPKLLAKVNDALRTNRARDRAADPQRLVSNVLVDDRTGLPWKKRAFITAWTKIKDHAAKETNRPGIAELVWHDFRRTRVVRLRRRSMPKEMIASITGHSLRSIEMMLEVYGPIDPTITASALAASL